MLPFLVVYLALGLAFELAFFTPHPDWSDMAVWGHILLWPGFGADALSSRSQAAQAVQASLSAVPWLAVALVALLLTPLPAVWLVRRGRSRSRLAGMVEAQQRATVAEEPPLAAPPERIEPHLIRTFP